VTTALLVAGLSLDTLWSDESWDYWILVNEWVWLESQIEYALGMAATALMW